jgi:hypothetical protein
MKRAQRKALALLRMLDKRLAGYRAMGYRATDASSTLDLF